MQLVHNGPHAGKSSILFLPMIDMNPSDVTCVYSTMMYIANHAKQYNCTPVLTFDQPLWWKASMIQVSEPKDSILQNMVLRLGGLHQMMSYLGSIGHTMANSGLKQVLETIYAANTIEHMLSGKAISRAIRGHIIVDASLNGMMLSKILETPLEVENTQQRGETPTAVSDISTRSETSTVAIEEGNLKTSSGNDGAQNKDLESLKSLYKNMMDGHPILDISSHDTLRKIDELLRTEKNQLHVQRTARLWIQYMEMIDILKKFIKAERLGNWDLHMEATREMLPYFASTGHNLYLKSAMLYLQKMSLLKDEHPNVYQQFQDGHHVGQRSEREWAGQSSDLMIEQGHMRALKSAGGLTRGGGMTEQ